MRVRREALLLLALVCQLLVIGSSVASHGGAGRRKLRYSWNPPAPPLPSYPCPRTQVPATPKTLWIDGSYAGTVSTGSPTQPFKTLVAAWRSLPAAPKRQLTGVTFNVRPGVVMHTNVWSPLEKLWGTSDSPVVFQRDPDADPALGPAIVHGELVMANSSYVFFKNLQFRPAGAGSNVIRASSSDFMYFLNVTVAGIYNQSYPGTSQALKVYNARGVYVEDSDVFGTAPGGWALTFINVQYGHVCRSQVHHADWCFGLTGGSAYMLMDGNNVHHCGQAALVSGLYGGYVTPVTPWVNYDAYNIKVTNNIVHDVWGAGLSVWGGYNILLAHNTLHKVGSRSHTVEIQLSSHGCSSTAATCAALNAQGAWVPLSGTPPFNIPTKDVYFLNNLVVNPANESAKWAHFATSPLVNYTGAANVPATLPRLVTMREGLIIKGNVFVNRHFDPKYAMGLGLDPCYNTGLPCDKPTVFDTNLINTPGLEISFIDPDALVLTEASKAALSLAPYKPAAEVPFDSWSTPVDTPVGVLSNEVPVDRFGVPRSAANDLPGANYDPAYQPAKFCSVGPDPAWAPNSTAGWPAECGRVLVGSVCTAACGSKATGVDYTARCDDSDKWTLLGGGCNTKSCASAPSPYLAPNSAGWDQSCAGGLFGATCTAACGANATGTGYTARCDDTNTWTVIAGACQGPPWQPATPPLPSYPCPRTVVPTNLTPKVLYVDPTYTGVVEAGSAAQPFKTFAKAWMRLGKGMLKAGVTINIRPGTALSGRLWMDGVWGTPDAPLVIQRDPAATPLDPPSVLEVVDIYNCTYMYFSSITFKIRPPGDGNVVHFASCSYMYLLNVTIAGIFNKGYPGTNQALKVNQVKGLYVEDSDISGSAPNGVGLDGVAVQYGHVCRSNIHHADWCMYLKGGSAYFIIDSNIVHACGQAGLEVGQGTGFEFMTPPWLEYEGYGMKLTNNVIYDVWGAGLGVNGGYSILIAHNTMYRVGSRSHTVEFNTGGRGCGGSAKCVTYYNMGGWGPALSTDGTTRIPTKDVMFLNNIVVNPANESAKWAHFAASAPIVTTGLAGYGPTMPNPVSVTEGLIIRGNVFVNRHLDPKYAMSLGLGQCDNTGLPCNTATVKAENLMNTPGLELAFTDPEALVLTDDSKAALQAAAYKPAALGPFAGWGTPLGTPEGQLSNEVPFDRSGLPRTQADLPGAWV